MKQNTEEKNAMGKNGTNLPSPRHDVAEATGDRTSQIVTFFVGEHLFGLPIDDVIEINRAIGITPVPLAPDYVSGLINLRGNILTAIHLGKRIGLADAGNGDRERLNNVVIGKRDEPVSILVERIGDVTAIPREEIGPPPDLMDGIDARFVKNVCKLPERLLVILDSLMIEDQGLDERRSHVAA